MLILRPIRFYTFAIHFLEFQPVEVNGERIRVRHAMRRLNGHGAALRL